MIPASKTDEHEFIESESLQHSLLGDPLSILGMSLETNRCKPNQTYIWCLPFDYNQEKHPFTCKIIDYQYKVSQKVQDLFSWDTLYLKVKTQCCQLSLTGYYIVTKLCIDLTLNSPSQRVSMWFK